jgi:hypothetical protein
MSTKTVSFLSFTWNITSAQHQSSMAELRDQVSKHLFMLIFGIIAMCSNTLLLLTIVRNKGLHTNCWMLIANVCGAF